MSVYGDIEVTHVAPDGKQTPVGIIRGIAVYTPGTIRRIKMDLANAPGVSFQAGKLLVTYSGLKDAKPVRYAEAELLLTQVNR
jgi:hypothetical protein